MTWREYNKLKEDEINNCLRNPVQCSEDSLFVMYFKRSILGNIISLLRTEGNVDAAEEYDRSNCFLNSVCGKVGEGSVDNPYLITTPYGDGGFVDLRRFLSSGKIPNYIENNSCHRNCYKFACRQKDDCEVITGLYKVSDQSHLHTIIGLNGVVLDFNWQLAMTESLYCKLFNFEVVNRIKNSKLKENDAFICSNMKHLNQEVTYAELLACYYEIVDKIKTNCINLPLKNK